MYGSIQGANLPKLKAGAEEGGGRKRRSAAQERQANQGSGYLKPQKKDVELILAFLLCRFLCVSLESV